MSTESEKLPQAALEEPHTCTFDIAMARVGAYRYMGCACGATQGAEISADDLASQLDRANAALRTVERERDEARGMRDAEYVRRIAHQQACDAAEVELSALRAQVAGLRESAVEFDDPRVGYVTIQVDRATWTALRATPTENGHER